MACNTTFVFKFNCVREMQTCSFCNMVYCKHHASPSNSVGNVIGGHHCPNFTKGATVSQFGESMMKGMGSMLGDFGSLDQTQIDKMNSVTEQIRCMGVKNTRDRGEVVLGTLAEMAWRVYNVGAKYQRIKDAAPNGWSLAHQEPQGALQSMVLTNTTKDNTKNNTTNNATKDDNSSSNNNNNNNSSTANDNTAKDNSTTKDNTTKDNNNAAHDNDIANVNDCLVNGLPAVVPSTLSMAVYTNDAQRLAVVAIRGHVVGDASHAMFHLLSVVRGHFPDTQLIAAVQLVKRWQDKGYVVIITGHAFGGYIAELVATHVGLAGAGFNSPTTGWHAGHQLLPLSNNTSSQRYVNVYVEGDGEADGSKLLSWTRSNNGHTKIILKNSGKDKPNKIATTIAMINAQVPHATNKCDKHTHATESTQGNEASSSMSSSTLGGYYNDVLTRCRAFNINISSKYSDGESST